MLNKKISKLVLCFSFFCLLVSVCYAQEKIIKLKDGTVMRAKVLSKENNQYRFESSTIGVVVVKESDVLMIEDPSAQNLPQKEADMYQKRIMENPEAVAAIQELAQDARVLEMLSDPNLKGAIMRQDMEYLKNNAKFQEFANSSTVKKIVADVSSESSGSSEK